MREKENRGFTLIELLAVIVILGVIMLIAVPSISNVITNARKDAYIRSAEAYIDAASKAIVSGEITAPLEGSSTYLKISELEIENGSQQSPFGSIFQEEKSYVKITNVSTNDVTKYQYAIALSDHKDNCIALTNQEDLLRNKVSTSCNITPLGKDPLANVRYIRDCSGIDSVTNCSYWVELKALQNGVNVALHKPVTIDKAVFTEWGSGTHLTITDGVIDRMQYTGAPANTCVTIDLESQYDLDEISVWRYWGRSYKKVKLEVSSDGNSWLTLVDGTDIATKEGMHYRVAK